MLPPKAGNKPKMPVSLLLFNIVLEILASAMK